MDNRGYSELLIQNWCLDIKVGALAGEREAAQPVSIDIALRFAKLPAACMSDKLEETVCYDRLLSQLRADLTGREYCLIEHLAHSVVSKLHQLVGTDCLARVKVTKLSPPVAGLAAAGFVISEY